jgi:hypothetical protein
MVKYFLIFSLLLFFSCNQLPADKGNNTNKTNSDTAVKKEPQIIDTVSKKIVSNGADTIAAAIVNNNSVELKNDTEGSRHPYNEEYNIEQVNTENGYLIAAQRTNALFDIYLNIDGGMDDDMMRDSNEDTVRKNKAKLEEPIKGVMECLKSHKGSVVEVLEYADLRYGQMCSVFSPNRSKFVVSYMIEKGIDPDRFIAGGFGYDEPWVMQEDNGIFKKGDTLTGAYISKLKSEDDRNKAYEILRSKQVEVIVLPAKR